MGSTKSAPTSIGGGGDSAFPTASASSFSSPLPSPSPGGFSAPSFGDSDFPGGGLLDGLSSGGLELSNPVGSGAVNAPEDVFKVESTLRGADLLDRAPGREFNSDTGAAIRNAQTKLNADTRLSPDRLPLKVDRLVNPGGPTEQSTRGLAGEVIKSNPAPRPRHVPQPPRPGPVKLKKPAPKPVLPAAPVAKTAPAPAFKPGQEAGLRRLAGGLSKVREPGPVANDIARAFRANPQGVAAEIKVIKTELQRLGGTPEQLKALDDGIRAELDGEHRQRFDRLVGPGGEGQAGETPDPRHETKIGKFEIDLEQQGFSKDEIKQRIDTFKKLDGPDASPEDKRTAKLFRIGMDLEQAREFAKLGDKRVNDLLDVANGIREAEKRSGPPGSLKQFLTGISGGKERLLPTKPLIIKDPTKGGRR